MTIDQDRAEVSRLWPDPGRLDDPGILQAYAMPDVPTLRVNFIASADGAVTVNGTSGALGGSGDRRVFDLLRVECDAVMVGAGTLRIEGYGPLVLDREQQAMRIAAGRTANPALVVVSAGLDIDPDPMLRDAPTRPWVITHAGSPADRRDALSRFATVTVCGETLVDARAAVAALTAAGLRHVLCEGGPHLFGTLAAAGVVDEVCLTISPSLAGPGSGRIIAGPAIGPTGLALAHVLRSESDELLLRYTRR